MRRGIRIKELTYDEKKQTKTLKLNNENDMEQEMIDNIFKYMTESAKNEADNWGDYISWLLKNTPDWDYEQAVHDAATKFNLDFDEVRNCFGWDEYNIVASQAFHEAIVKYREMYSE